MERAESLRDNGFYRFAIANYTRSIEFNQGDQRVVFLAHFGRARTNWELREYEPAADEYSQLILLALLFGEGSEDDVFQNYQAMFLCRRANCHIQLGRYEEAIDDLEAALWLRPDDNSTMKLLKKAREKAACQTDDSHAYLLCIPNGYAV